MLNWGSGDKGFLGPRVKGLQGQCRRGSRVLWGVPQCIDEEVKLESHLSLTRGLYTCGVPAENVGKADKETENKGNKEKGNKGKSTKGKGRV